MKQIICTEKAPKAIGPYSQAVKAGNTVYLSGQIGVDPATQALVTGGAAAQAKQLFKNLEHVAHAAGGSLNAIVKLTIYLLDMKDFEPVNEIMKNCWQAPYPARACVAVKQLPKGAQVEADAIMVLAED